MRRTHHISLAAWGWQLVAGGLALLFVLPLYWLFTSALRPAGSPPPRTVEWFPYPATLTNFQRIFELAPMGQYFLNSLIVASLAVPLTLLTASLAGFAMCRAAVPIQRSLLLFSIVLLLIPTAALWLPRYILFARLGLLDTWLPLLAPTLMGSNALYVLLFYWSFRRISPELFDAARLEGSSTLNLWWHIGMPLVRPTSLVVLILSFLSYWNDFLMPFLYLKSESRYLLPVGISLLQQMDTTQFPLLLAGAVIMTVPALVLFWAVQHAFWYEGRFSEIAHTDEV